MALKVHSNGYVEVTTEKDALKALKRFRELQDTIKEIREETDLDAIEKDAVAYKVAAQEFLIKADIEHIQGDGWHGTIVKGSSGSRWIATDDDLTGDEPKRCKSLQSIIEEITGGSIKKKGSKARKIWLKITKRVLDPEAIEDAVNEKLLKVDEISPAWIEIPRAPYLRIFEDE